MTITVRSLAGMSYNLPYYPNMRVGQYITQIAAPALGSNVGVNGEVLDPFVLNGSFVFTKDNKEKYLSEVMQDGSTLHNSLALGPVHASLFDNGNLRPPTPYQLTMPSGGVSAPAGPAASKKRKI